MPAPPERRSSAAGVVTKVVTRSRGTLRIGCRAVRTTHGPDRITVLEIAPGGELKVFRIVRSENPDDPVFLNSLRSHYELSDEPRKVERRWTVIHMGISVYLSADRATRTALLWPKLGEHVASFQLGPDMGFNYGHTGHTGHLTLWADPVKLRDSIVDVESVSEQRS